LRSQCCFRRAARNQKRTSSNERPRSFPRRGKGSAPSLAADLAPEEREAAVVAAMREVVDDDRLEFLMQLSIDPVLATLVERPA
jgi:hypothetical protein